MILKANNEKKMKAMQAEIDKLKNAAKKREEQKSKIPKSREISAAQRRVANRELTKYSRPNFAIFREYCEYFR